MSVPSSTASWVFWRTTDCRSSRYGIATLRRPSAAVERQPSSHNRTPTRSNLSGPFSNSPSSTIWPTSRWVEAMGIPVRREMSEAVALARPGRSGGVRDPVLDVGQDRAGGRRRVLGQVIEVLGVLDQLGHVGGPNELAVPDKPDRILCHSAVAGLTQQAHWTVPICLVSLLLSE